MRELYIHKEDVHNMVAPNEVVPIIVNLVKPQSVLDVGCGTGTWLKAFEANGISDYVGIDGEYVKKSLLRIPETNFVAKDLRKSWSLNREFDLVVSLEVAEHLPETSADIFVNALVTHGNTILFSAAIPGQGGQNHLNEQWPQYWQERFLKHGFYFHDTIRPLIWDNDNVDWWYRQNLFLVTKNPTTTTIRNLVHPGCLSSQIEKGKYLLSGVLSGQNGVVQSLKILQRSINKKIFK